MLDCTSRFSFLLQAECTRAWLENLGASVDLEHSGWMVFQLARFNAVGYATPENMNALLGGCFPSSTPDYYAPSNCTAAIPRLFHQIGYVTAMGVSNIDAADFDVSYGKSMPEYGGNLSAFDRSSKQNFTAVLFARLVCPPSIRWRCLPLSWHAIQPLCDEGRDEAGGGGESSSLFLSSLCVSVFVCRCVWVRICARGW